MQKNNSYQIVRQLILKQIKEGTLLPGDKLPSERALCSDLSLNRNTVRHALLLLQREGKIFRLERKGWYVSTLRLSYNPVDHVNFARLAASQGLGARWSTTDLGTTTMDRETDSGKEGFAMGRPVYKMENIYFLEEQKVAYTLTYLDKELLPGIVPKTVDRAMTQVIEEEYGMALRQRNLLIRPLLLPRKITLQLNISLGSPGIYVRRTKTGPGGRVLTVEHEYWRFDAIELRVDIH
ncbi:MAG: GntR family transcriptional regulator [Desulfobacter sp.]|nr:MAG: GntR family transcriptional regulator [Desulfobacter sp.]